MSDTAFLDATAQAELVRRGEVSAEELVEAALARIERLDRQLGALVFPLFDRARATVRDGVPEGPFAGVPFLLKDIGAELAGTPLREGSRFLEGFVCDEDDEVVTRYERAGLVIAGRTKAPEFGILPTTEPKAFGPARNPWDPQRTTGGSSGGSAAAVAAGMVAAAHATDGGGSIRIPASCCGLFGLKPTRARVTRAPHLGDVYGGLVESHVLTRSVRDSAGLLDVAAGPAPGDPYLANVPARRFSDEVGDDPGRLRIALTSEALTETPMHEECVQAVRAAAALCEELGHEVSEVVPDLDADSFAEHFIRTWASANGWLLRHWERRVRREATPDDLEPLTWALAQIGLQTNAADFLVSREELQRASRTIAREFVDYDIWLTPVLSEPPLPLGSFDGPEDNPLFGLVRAAQFAPFTAVANVTGQPAMSVPLHWTDGGLPIGAHFTARFGDEATLFRLAAQLEAARPWADRRPPVAA